MTSIEAVRIVATDGVEVELPWTPGTWYLIRDDRPFIDIRTRGHGAQARGETKLVPLGDVTQEGTRWQRWDLEADLARQRRLGEMSLELKVPKDTVLRCYVVPTAILGFRDVVAMVDDIEKELGTPAAWDMLSDRPDRSWSGLTGGSRANAPTELLRMIEEEEEAARWIRREPFTEPGPASRNGAALSENAIVSHWAVRRSGQLRDMLDTVEDDLKTIRAQAGRVNPDGRQTRLDEELARLEAMVQALSQGVSAAGRLIRDVELGTAIHPSPLFQRDHRLRLLLRVFAPPSSEALSEVDSNRSHYPPVFLNHLWELWGAVWIVRSLRYLGFSGYRTDGTGGSLGGCSWRLSRGDATIELDFEAHPAMVDYGKIPPAHERDSPALEWAARNQDLDWRKPYIGLEPRCSPDYLMRITTLTGKALLVGDACLASPAHHGKKSDKSDAKPHVVEHYRRTVGWAAEDGMVRCHPLGGFVVFPPPAEAWSAFERLPGAGDTTLVCPNPLGDAVATARLEQLLHSVMPSLRSGTEAENLEP